MKKVYVAGPMRGLPHGNLPAFDEAEARWLAAGWQVMSPARLVRALNYTQRGPLEATECGDDFHNASRSHLNHVFQIDFACLFAADAIALLPGWEASMGATAELALAQVLGLEVYCAVEMKSIQPISRPWKRLRCPGVSPSSGSSVR